MCSLAAGISGGLNLFQGLAMRGAATDAAEQTAEQEKTGVKSAEDSKRNQQLALLMAEKIKNKDILFLSAGTDGTDGPTNDAGGLVDGNTINLGSKYNLDHNKHLQNANSGNYLEKSKSLVTTGPTGTNVMDLILAIKK